MSCSRPATKKRSTFGSRRWEARILAPTAHATLWRKNESMLTSSCGTLPKNWMNDAATARSWSWFIPTMLMAWLTVEIRLGKP